MRFLSSHTNPRYFNPRAPRGARPEGCQSQDYSRGISIHALREERDFQVMVVSTGTVISIHALREERDRSSRANFSVLGGFQSTRSARSATYHVRLLVHHQRISIHALREERDSLL